MVKIVLVEGYVQNRQLLLCGGQSDESLCPKVAVRLAYGHSCRLADGHRPEPSGDLVPRAAWPWIVSEEVCQLPAMLMSTWVVCSKSGWGPTMRP